MEDRIKGMLTRRRFLQGTLAASGLAASGLAASGLASGGAAFANPLASFACGHVAIEDAVFEPGCGPSAAFAAEARHLGLKTFGITDDITPVWTGVVAKWRRTPLAIAGLTSYVPLLLLEQSGRDHGLRVVFRAEHKAAVDGAIVHILDGPERMLRAFRMAAGQRDSFGSCMASVIGLCPQDTRQPAKVSLRTPATGENRIDAPLYSWVIAPRPIAT
jgi:hypothetical protein